MDVACPVQPPLGILISGLHEKPIQISLSAALTRPVRGLSLKSSSEKNAPFPKAQQSLPLIYCCESPDVFALDLQPSSTSAKSASYKEELSFVGRCVHLGSAPCESRPVEVCFKRRGAAVTHTEERVAGGGGVVS